MKKCLFAFLILMMLAVPVSSVTPAADFFAIEAAAATRVESLEAFSSLSSGKLKMTVGAEETFKVMVQPENATNKTLKWTTADKKVVTVSNATVSSSGIASVKLTAVKEGSAKVTYSTTDGSGISGSFTVVVQPLVETLTLDQTVKSITRNSDGEKLTATVTPSDAGNQKLKWFSSDESVCKVDYNGALYPVSNGECYISVATTDGSDIVKTCRLVVAEKAKSLTISKSTATLANGKSLTLYATVVTTDGSKHDAVKWTSSNTKVATVSQDGVVSTKYPGTATIKATAVDGTGKSVSCAVNVTQKITKITLPESVNVAVGKKKKITATITPTYATENLLFWSSDNTSVATVSVTGAVTGKKAGVANITCTTADGKVTAKCKVNVVIPATSVQLDLTEKTLWKGKGVTLHATVAPSDATDKTVTWSSSDTAVATVSTKGYVKAVAGGVCKITVKNSAGKTAYCIVTVKESATGIEIDEIIKTMYVGQVDRLSATVLPATATNRNVIWSTSNSSVATVDSDGDVHALKVGSVTITAESVDGGFTAKCKITVNKKIPVTGVSIDKKAFSVKVGGTYQLIGIVSPSNASEKRIKWSSDNTSVATVGSTGVVKGKKAGTAVITATSYDGNYTSKAKVTVVQPVTGVSLSATTAKITVGKTKKLTCTISPSNATNKSVTWSSSDKSVATVSNGVVTAKKAGSAVITVKTADGGFVATCNVTVRIPVTGVSVSVDTLNVPKGQTRLVTAVVSPSNATNKAVTWSSSNKKVATVSSTGKVTGVAKGTAVITCKTKDGSFKATCEVTVVQLVEKIKLNAVYINLETGKYKTITAKVTPSSASSSDLKWKSSDKKVAQVSSKGVVKAVGAGTATITAYSADGNAEARCTVKVTQPATGVKITSTKNIVKLGKTITLKATVLPSDASDKKVTWISSNTAKATVTSKGVVKGISQGYVTITVKTADGKHSASLKVLVAKSVKGISLDKKTININVGKSTTVKPVFTPADATIKTVKWYSDNNDIATVDKNGKITAKKGGYAKITAVSTDGSFKATAEVNVISPIKKVELNKKTIYLNVNQKFTLVPKFTPTDATIRTVAWKTSNKKIATVNGNGVVKGIKKGEATITCTINGSKKVTCKVYVVKRVTDVTLNHSSKILYLGDKLTLKTTIYPVDATVKDVTFTSSDKTIASVNSKGVVTPLNVGKVTITATTKDGSFKAKCKVTVKKAPESIKISASKLSLSAGKTATLTYTVSPADATNKKATFKSSNTKIVKVSSSGKITAVSKGTATVTATTENGIKATCKVTVMQQVKSVETDPSATVYTGKSVTLYAGVLPADANNKNLKWSSSDTSVAKVSSKGKVTGIRAGSATITVTSAENSKIKATCKVTVKQHVTSLAFTQAEIFLNKGASSQLEYNLLPVDATNKKVTFKSSDTSVVTVTNEGRITALSSGVAQISVVSSDVKSVTAVCDVNVVEPASGVSLDIREDTIYVGSTLTLNATVSPSDAHNKLVLWSSDSAIASVDSDGVVTALRSGTAVITVTTVDGGHKASCTLNILQRATSVEVDRTELTILRGEACQLVTTVLPEDCYDKSYIWVSADPGIATVSAEGLVTAVAPGKVKLTCKSLESGVSATVEVTVHEPVASVDIAETEAELYTPLKKELSLTVLPENASDKSVTWTSSDENVVTVDENGVVTAVGKGEATVTATSNDTGVSDSCKFIIFTGVEDIMTDKAAYSLYENTSLQINLIFNPENADDTRVVFESSDESIFTVSDEGMITGLVPGDAELTITSVQNPEVKKVIDVSVTRAVTGISLGESEKVLYAGNSAVLSAEIYPADATDKTVIWTSSDSEIASVDASGNITANARGFVTITATSQDGSFSAECAVEVIQLPEEITGDSTELTAYMGRTLAVNMTVLPEDANDKTLIWSSSDEAVATVDSNGVVTPVSTGTCYIIAGSAAAPEIGRRVKLTVVQLCEEIRFSSRIPDMFAGEKVKIAVDVLPENATDKSLQWTSSDESVAVVDNSGIITAINPGKVIITAKCIDSSEVTASFELSVVAEISGIGFDASGIKLGIGEIRICAATVMPESAYDKTIIYTSSDNEIVTVDSEGRLTANKLGTAYITAVTADGKYTASLTVTVIKPAEEIRLFRTDFEMAEGGRLKVEYEILPADTIETVIIWESSDNSVVTVDENGIITATGKGEATVTLNVADSDIKATVNITVM